MGDDNHGFSKLNEESSIHGNIRNLGPPLSLEGCGTRINLGFGRCLKVNVKAEKEDGNLRIGRNCALAQNCHQIVLIFGFCFLLAGATLTTLAYKTKLPEKTLISDEGKEEGKVAGPLFVVIGSILIIMGVGLSIVACKVNQAAKRQQMNHFSLQNPLPTTPTEFFSEFANIHDSNGTFGPRSTGTASSSDYTNTNSRRESFFNSSFFSDRRKTLPTIAQAVPVGFFMDGKFSGVSDGSCNSTRFHSRSELCQADKLNQGETDGISDFNQAQQQYPAHHHQHQQQYNLHRKASLSLRPSLPIPIISPSSFIRTRSDMPFGSIVSLSCTKDIASFPVAQNTSCQNPAQTPTNLFETCVEENISINETPTLGLPVDVDIDIGDATTRTTSNITMMTTSMTTSPLLVDSGSSSLQVSCRELPAIQVNSEPKCSTTTVTTAPLTYITTTTNDI